MIISAVTVLMLSACQSVSYYAQSVSGHTKLMLARKPVDKVLASSASNTDPKIVGKLKLSKELKAFAVERLALPDNRSYSSYVALDREYPVWVVVAAQPFSLSAKQWCYPIIGCASYRGYFSERAAQKYAHGLANNGWETYVGGASAYSTLGWFSDPLLPSMMTGSDASFAEVLFHELAHQVLYKKGDSDFNEAFASVVGEQGALLWLREKQPHAVSRYQASLAARRDFSRLIERLKDQLNMIYTKKEKTISVNAEQAVALKIEAKAAAIEQFRSDYEALKLDRWNGIPYYDAWLTKPINNARLAAFSTYHSLLPDFEVLFDVCGRDFAVFYGRLKQKMDISKMDECDAKL